MTPKQQPAAHFVQIGLRPGALDVRGAQIRAQAADLGIDTGLVQVSRVYALDVRLAPEQLLSAATSAWLDRLQEVARVDELVAPGQAWILISRLPGVTDDEGRTAHDSLAAALPALALGREQRVFSMRLYAFEEALAEDALRRLGDKLLGNPMVDHVLCSQQPLRGVWLPRVHLPKPPAETPIDLSVPDEALLALSRNRGLNLNLPEMRAIAEHYGTEAPDRAAAGLGQGPTECELEVFAQTWSEHCKHKEFNAVIDMSMGMGPRARSWRVDSLFKTYIAGATQKIREKYQAIGQDWMITVFSDNAGVVEFDQEHLFVLKVETHNSPSALDPVGGAMTGVLGNNRDAFGTGKGGARLLFNTNVLCFAPADWSQPLLPGQLHPKRIADGVVSGIEQAGNKSGVPTVNGAVVFDRRYAGKPLVYCGTGALLPRTYPNGPAWHKDIQPGDCIVVVGGRVGKDGIHGATFSSGELTDAVAGSVVQIGSPMTQKLVSDFLEEACSCGLIAGCTDNGAGGLASSVGELATHTSGADIELAHIPRKYEGLQPWEVLLSEAQERMTLAVRPADLPALRLLAVRRGVEATEIGHFTQSGLFEVRWLGRHIARLSLDFLHHGVPRKHLIAQWMPVARREPELGPVDGTAALVRLLGSPNIASRERVIRQYDHEVKGKTVVKPLMGELGIAPQDAAVVRAHFGGWQGVAVASGLCPKFGDLDPYEMSAGAFDEAVRSLVSVGVPLPMPGERPSWSACDNFCVPDSVFHPELNPDGKKKLGQLVRMCEALYDMSVLFDVPMTSGKDSMKNDFRAGGQKISVPPTVLYTMVARMADVRRAITSEWKAAGDLIYLVGETHNELGGSELYSLYDQLGAHVPKVRAQDAKRRYLALGKAQQAGLVQSSHDCSDGGLAVCLAECCIGSGLGASIFLAADGLSDLAWLFAESHSRLIVSVRRADAEPFEALMDGDAALLGATTLEPLLTVTRAGEHLVVAQVDALTAAWRSGGPG